jgi:hypothetical protein
MRVLVTGSTGLVGSALVPGLARGGHEVVRAVRREPRGPGEVRWDPATGELTPSGHFGAVVHLAGASLSAWRWTAGFKRRAWASRVDATRALCERLAALEPPPELMVAASAIGYYGDRGDELLDETSPPGRGFLAELVVAWEAACAPLARAGARVANLRLGLVMGPGALALAPLLGHFQLGLGGPLGTGRQFWSWVGLSDVAGAFRHTLDHGGIGGAVNVVAPAPVRQRDFARALGRVMGRPAVVPAPAWVLRLVMGEMADEVVLSSARVLPRRLAENGFGFRQPELEGALREALTSRG